MDADNCKGLKVLIVDDESINRLFLSVLLKKMGYQIFEAQNGSIAVTMAQQIVPDLILMDLSMPVMDGITASKQLSLYSSTCIIPIVPVTAYDSEDYRQRCQEAGMKGFITKPVQPEKLFSTINEILESNMN